MIHKQAFLIISIVVFCFHDFPIQAMNGHQRGGKTYAPARTRVPEPAAQTSATPLNAHPEDGIKELSATLKELKLHVSQVQDPSGTNAKIRKIYGLLAQVRSNTKPAEVFPILEDHLIAIKGEALARCNFHEEKMRAQLDKDNNDPKLADCLAIAAANEERILDFYNEIKQKYSLFSEMPLLE